MSDFDSKIRELPEDDPNTGKAQTDVTTAAKLFAELPASTQDAVIKQMRSFLSKQVDFCREV